LPTAVNRVFTSTQLLLKLVNVQTPYYVVFRVAILLRAFKVYVRPILEFNTTVWLPVQKKDIEAIEKVQRRFTKRLSGLSAYSYSERLQKLNLQSSELRRIHYDLTLTYQIVFSLSLLKCHEFFQLNGRSTAHGHRFKLMKQQCRGYRRYFFTTRVVNIWNFLPKYVVSFSRLHCVVLKTR